MAGLDSFYRPTDGLEATGSGPYEELAKEMHEALVDEAKALIPLASLVDLLHIVRLNSHTVVAHDPAGRPLPIEGLGLFPWLHLTNHSCSPNATFSGKLRLAFAVDSPEGLRDGSAEVASLDPLATIELTASRDIAGGEEVSVSYLEDELLRCPANVRQRILRRDFGFRCKCSRCMRERFQAV